ncbi:appr-1-p processing domain-containing protein [Agrilactobacillus composti DSM 18527 = JCM 14202]|uniref:Appr-1-p processing domain-containing protein n=1 Tax=Agrilactobacillus composti DSM 18527 = JCM 14202 TaxID=1423734 RepID=X0QQ34_9LACO|nr:O-acetyl-ADP-ribose deacetylase [Agrilactobacillus composti]KRM33295.1 appr-1-p processing domain-containing protein [Agrilactobacillus composti DSM 18527 = JCM 14202]GAF40735.1 macro domain, possibly ADP-ribose binding module [Agrilactobacillus composti DSM 18527 = JCM 14202]
MKSIEIIQGDITKSQVDAIVNAANTSLMGGGGVDGAIHRAAGLELDEACRKLNGCPTGEAKTTLGFNLPAKYIIHTPGPIWRGGQQHEAQLLHNSYWHSLAEAEAHECATVDFPSISTGVYRFPLDQAATIALEAMVDFLKTSQFVQQIRLVAFDPVTKKAFETAYRKLNLA